MPINLFKPYFETFIKPSGTEQNMTLKYRIKFHVDTGHTRSHLSLVITSIKDYKEKSSHKNTQG